MDRFKRFKPEFHPLIRIQNRLQPERVTNPTRRDAEGRRSHMKLKFEDRGLRLLLMYRCDSLERSKGYRQQTARHGAIKNLRKYLRI